MVQQNQIENLTRQLEDKRTQEIGRVREAEQTRLKHESALLEMQRQLKQEQFNYSELKAKFESEKH